MNVETEADRCLDKARDYSAHAIEQMSKVVVTYEVQGTSEFTTGTHIRHRKALSSLMDARDYLDGIDVI